ncbi:hypothetical protein QJS10_CPA09g01107 [Acorus calamus]|uniref:Secreted protein n=1 Tax=Acorus calamus TaxID=4465 RepID=A0AAV9E3X3_ACOCL|nr:hypothetical protein QJS10_CPA09g01107 [Acorus calamus]
MKILSFSLCFYPTGAFSPYQEADVCVGAVDEGDCPHVTPRPVDSHGPLRDDDGNGEQKSHVRYQETAENCCLGEWFALPSMNRHDPNHSLLLNTCYAKH